MNRSNKYTKEYPNLVGVFSKRFSIAVMNTKQAGHEYVHYHGKPFKIVRHGKGRLEFKVYG